MSQTSIIDSATAGGTTMSKFFRARLSVEKSANSDYSNPEWPPRLLSALALTPDECLMWEPLVAAVGGGTTLTTSHLDSATFLAVQNQSTTPGCYVTATFRSAANGATDNKVRIAENNGLFVTTDFAVANNLVLVGCGSGAQCLVIVCGT